MNATELSIIVPVYNVESYIEKCINSIISQVNMKKNFIELILINDGSTDNSGLICDNYCKLYSFIKVYHRHNEGLSVARNYGLKKANGTYVWFVDSDDYINNGSLNKVLKEIKNKDVDILLGDCHIVDVDENITGKLIHKGLINHSIYSGLEVIKNQIEVMNDYITMVWAGVYKKDYLIKNKLYFEQGLIHEDELWTPSVLVKATRVGYINDVIYSYRIRPNSIMRSNTIEYSKHIESFIYIFNKLYIYMDNYIKDKYVLSLIKDNISKRYLHDIVHWKFYKYPMLYKRVNRKQIFYNSLKLKNKIRSIVLLLNKNFYSRLLFFKVGGISER